MTGYTSGKTTHDPEPYMIGSPIDGRTYRCATEATVPVEFCDYAPRPEYDNHNPILAALREYCAAWPGANVAEVAQEWLDLPADQMPASSSFNLRRTPFAQILHARRILAKLAALTQNGVTD